MSNRRNRPQCGVSLIECCAALALSSILATAGVSSFKDLTERRRLEGRSAELVADLHLLRSEAISRHQALRIEFRSDQQGSCYVIHRGPASSCTCDTAGAATCEEPAVLVKGIRFAAAEGVRLSSNVPTILLDEARGTASPGGTIRLTTTNGQELRHVVSIMGRVRTCAYPQKIANIPAC